MQGYVGQSQRGHLRCMQKSEVVNIERGGQVTQEGMVKVYGKAITKNLRLEMKQKGENKERWS